MNSKEYTEHLLDLTDKQYYSKEYPSVQLQYSILDPDYCWSQTRRSHTQSCNPVCYYPPSPDSADIQCWHAHGRGKHALLHGHRLFGEKTCSAEGRKARKRQQNFNQHIRKLSSYIFFLICKT